MSKEIPSLNLEGAVMYHYDRFPPLSLDYGQIIPQLVKATDAIARYDQMLKNLHNSEILLAPLRDQEAIISSRIEGTISTMDEILEYEAEYDEDSLQPEHTRSATIETILYKRSLWGAQQAMKKGHPLGQYLIRGAHQHLLSFGRGAAKSPGQYKTEQNYLADKHKNVLFVPITPERLQDGMDRLFDYIENSTDTPLIKAAISHIEFEALHPFQDGNGRIGRMLITLLLWSSKVISAPHFYISGYLEEHKDRYIDTMKAVSEHDNWTAWCIFFLEAVEKQAHYNLQIAESITSLYESMKLKFSDALGSKYSVQALDFVFTHPVFRNNTFTKKSGIPSQTAARFTRVLAEKGLIFTLRPSAGQRAALFAFKPLIELVRV